LLPLLVFGPNNDLLLRASAPSLVMLLILTLTLFQPANSPPAEGSRPWLIVAMLSIGAFTPFHEFGRAVMVRRWLPNYESIPWSTSSTECIPATLHRPTSTGQTCNWILRDPAIIPGHAQRQATKVRDE
jgi:hypothetical protein